MNETTNPKASTAAAGRFKPFVMCDSCSGDGIRTELYGEGVGYANSYCNCVIGVIRRIGGGHLVPKAGRGDGNDTKCGCYYCINTFYFSDVTDFVDGGTTALCPKCGIDSVVANVTDEYALRVMNLRYF